MTPSPERVAGCPSDAEILSSGVCLAFLPSCPLGCSRYDDDDGDGDDDDDGDDGDDDNFRKPETLEHDDPMPCSALAKNNTV